MPEKKFSRHSWKWKNILSSRHFRTSFSLMFSLFIGIFLFVGGIGAAANAQKLKLKLEESAAHAASSVSAELMNMKSGAVFLGNLSSVTHVLASPEPSLDQLSQMISDVAPYCSIYSYDDIFLFFGRSERIFDTGGGMYTYDEFYDPDFLETVTSLDEEEIWLFNLSWKRYYAEPSLPAVVYVHKLPLYTMDKTGYLAVSCSLAQLQGTAAAAVSSQEYPALITFRNQLLYTSDDRISDAWDEERTLSQNLDSLFGKCRFYSFRMSNSTSCTFYLTASQWLSAILPFSVSRIWLWFGVLPLIFAAAVLYTTAMLRPVDEIMRKLGITPYTSGLSGDRDEFSRLNTALDNINLQMNSLDRLIQQNQQLIRERLLTGLLHNYVLPGRIPDEYEKNGLLFPWPFYSVILITLPSLEQMRDFARQEQIRLLILSNSTEAFQVLGYAYGLYTDNSSICILLNTPRHEPLKDEIAKICAALKERIEKKLCLPPLFSVGICHPQSPDLWQTWQLAKKNCIYTSADTEDFLIFSIQTESPSSDTDLIERLSRSLIDRDRVSAMQMTSAFIADSLSCIGFEEGQRICEIVLCSVYATLLDFSGNVPQICLSTFLRRLENASTLEECQKCLTSCISNLLDAKNKLSPESRNYVRRAADYIERHYQEAVAIPQIADFVGLNSVYLSRLFKLSTGKTLSEYLNYYRNEQSLSMLTDTDETIASISQRVGYHDVRSYIRFFKKFYGCTPSDYRRNHRI